MEAIEANIKQAEIEVNTAETNVGYTKITAPMDGTVIQFPFLKVKPLMPIKRRQQLWPLLI